MKTRLSPIARLEAAEAETWHDYRQAHREMIMLEKAGRKAAAKEKKRRVLALNRRHGQLMNRIAFLTRQRIYEVPRG